MTEPHQTIKPTEKEMKADPAMIRGASSAERKDTKGLGVEAAEKKVIEEKKDGKKLTIGQKIKKEAQHYWDGTKLLATEVKISTKLALKMAAGYELSRRENRQVRDLPESASSCRNACY